MRETLTFGFRWVVYITVCTTKLRIGIRLLQLYDFWLATYNVHWKVITPASLFTLTDEYPSDCGMTDLISWFLGVYIDMRCMIFYFGCVSLFWCDLRLTSYSLQHAKPHWTGFDNWLYIRWETLSKPNIVRPMLLVYMIVSLSHFCEGTSLEAVYTWSETRVMDDVGKMIIGRLVLVGVENSRENSNVTLCLFMISSTRKTPTQTPALVAVCYCIIVSLHYCITVLPDYCIAVLLYYIP